MSGFLKEFKPSYTYAFILFYIAFEIPVPIQAFYALRMNKAVDLPYPWDINKLDGSWKVGVDDRMLRLGEFVLDGSHRLGETVPGHAWRQLYNGIITVSRRLRKFLSVEPGVYARIGESKLKVGCGGWRLGKNSILCLSDARMRKAIEINTPPLLDVKTQSHYTLCYPESPAQIVGVHKLSGLKRLDGRWKIGAPVRPLRLGEFRIARGASILVESSGTMRKEIVCGLPRRLARYNKLGVYQTRRLDGSWRLGAYNKVDGSWRLRPGKRLAAPRFTYPIRRLDGDWRLGPEQDVKLDGSWRISEAHGPQIEFTIKKIPA